MEDKKQTCVVDGFIFYNEKMADKASREYEGIKYIRSKTDMENADVILQLYNKIMEQKLFETPVGINFLRELQEYLYAIPVIRKSEIRPIDVEEILMPDIQEHIKEKNVTLDKLPPKQQQNQNPSPSHSKEKSDKKVFQAALKKQRKKTRISVVVNVFLLLLVSAMFWVALTSKNANILNYERNLVDKYAQWEQQLKEREQVIREKEQSLDISL